MKIDKKNDDTNRGFHEGLKETKHDDKNDTLTGLYCSEVFLDAAQELVSDRQEEYALVYLDIGNFKAINKNLGYDVGDRVLKECAHFLSEKVADVVMTGRIYGDKFALLCRKYRKLDDTEIRDNAYSINSTLLSHIRTLSGDENIMVYTGLYNLMPGEDMRSALSKAKLAKNAAKRMWTSRIVIYEDWMIDDVEKNYELTGNVDAAIENHEFQVYLQPKVNSETMQVVGAEALVRWKRPDGKMLFPDEFIPVFEKNGKVVDIDYYVYEEVFSYLRNRLDRGCKVVPVSMNVSRVHLRSGDFLKKIDELLEKYRVPCEYLEFELTENVYVEKMQEALPFIESIRKKNIKVSIDDFGSGYSSLNVISGIPLDTLKLDKAFMKRGAELTRKDRAVIAHLVELARDIELEVLCEGVETQVQADFVKDIGCPVWQGYCFAKPMPMDEFDRCLDNGVRSSLQTK